MRFFDNVKLSVKLPVILILLVAATLVASELSAFREARLALLSEGDLRLDALADGRTSPEIGLAWDLARNSLIIMTVFGTLGYFLARSLTRPIVDICAAMGAVADKKFDTAIHGAERGCEIGFIAKTLETFRDALAASELVARDGAFKGAAFEGSSAALMMIDKDYKISYANAAVLKILRDNAEEFRTVHPLFNPDKVVGRPITDFLSQTDKIMAVMRDQSRLPDHGEMKMGGARFTLDINAVSTPEEGRIGTVVEWRDVTIERMNGAVLTAIDRNQATAEFDVKGLFVKANANFLEMLGLSAQSIAGKTHEQLLRYNSAFIADRGKVWDRLMGGESVFGRFWMEGADGKEAVIDGGFSPVLDSSGQPLKVVLMGSNVTKVQLSLRAADAERKAMAEAQAQVVDALRVGLSRLSEGDLTANIDHEFVAEYEELRHDFNSAAERLAEAISTVIDNASSIQGEAAEISNAADDLSRRTERQAATLEQTATALDELTSSVQSAASGASEANRVVTEARSSAEASGNVVREAVSAMGEISSSSDKISKIISVIDDIAFQTNLLALNAGVEAARAGEAGRGFAVVASEVRALAQRSSEAAREINELISTSSGHVKRGVDLVGQTGEALRKIVVSVSDISTRVSEISASAQEQSAGLAEINIAVNQLDQVTQQNAAMFEQTTAASHSLTREAEALSATTARFRIAGDSTGRGANVTAPAGPSAGSASFSSRRGGTPRPCRARNTQIRGQCGGCGRARQRRRRVGGFLSRRCSTSPDHS